MTSSGTEDTERSRTQDPAEGADRGEGGDGAAQAHAQEPAEGADDPAVTDES